MEVEGEKNLDLALGAIAAAAASRAAVVHVKHEPLHHHAEVVRVRDALEVVHLFDYQLLLLVEYLLKSITR